ncbi:PepSY domain-containing protein [Suilimivivens aceti]|uniref:PepSY domain-containing protein n=1 Tax=Suilimivivens aceti TaxID=2981774 RepID=A0ABT2T1L3_9FIRM|nr:PepSY domain-containing protein [Suilimivivens aceti]MCU6744143.1 PepSY domain-containing protein [Suilimivivens aceti]SCH56238.1 Peptidase propeptide and YPEB domain [uncultured Clostridium sp.]
MRKKWIFTGAAFALAVTLTGCRDNAAASIPQPSSQEQTKEQTQMIPMEEAQEAADATITKSKLDYEDGRQVYDIEWYAGGAKYDYEIAADTGEIISSAYEEKTVGANSNNVTVSEADAKKTALDRVSGATDKDIYEWKLDYDDGRPEYEGKIIYGGTEYEFTIDAATGSVMEWDAEKIR